MFVCGLNVCVRAHSAPLAAGPLIFLCAAEWRLRPASLNSRLDPLKAGDTGRIRAGRPINFIECVAQGLQSCWQVATMEGSEIFLAGDRPHEWHPATRRVYI